MVGRNDLQSSRFWRGSATFRARLSKADQIEGTAQMHGVVRNESRRSLVAIYRKRARALQRSSGWRDLGRRAVVSMPTASRKLTKAIPARMRVPESAADAGYAGANMDAGLVRSPEASCTMLVATW